MTRGKTPVLSGDEMRQLLESIDTSDLIGLRDRALIGVMGYTFARVSAVGTLRVEDCFRQGRRSWLRLHKKGGKRHEVPCHHSLDDYLHDWIAAAGIGEDKKGPLFRSFKKGDRLTENAVTRSDVLYMIKRRAKRFRTRRHCSHNTIPRGPLSSIREFFESAFYQSAVKLRASPTRLAAILSARLASPLTCLTGEPWSMPSRSLRISRRVLPSSMIGPRMRFRSMRSSGSNRK
jgi:integrase